MKAVIADAAAIVGLLSKTDEWRKEAAEIFETLEGSLVTCEAVITECCFVMRDSRNGEKLVLDLLESRAVKIDFALSKHVGNIAALMEKYQSVPMSLADACLVRMSEIFNAPIFTFDSDFTIYRRHGRQRIPLIGLRN